AHPLRRAAGAELSGAAERRADDPGLDRRSARALHAPSGSERRRVRRVEATPAASCSEEAGTLRARDRGGGPQGRRSGRGREALTAPPLLILGVRRSGTTLLRVMLDRHSELAIPDESYFIPQLADRHRGTGDVDEFADDLRRLPT